MTLKSIEELSAERFLLAKPLPSSAFVGTRASPKSASAARLLPVKWRAPEEFMKIPALPNAAETPDAWEHWGLND